MFGSSRSCWTPFQESNWRGSIKISDVSSLEPSRNFKFYILASEDSLSIALNDVHFCKYPMKLKDMMIRTVEVTGELEKVTQVDHRKVFPSAWPPVFEDLVSTAFSSDSPYEFTPGSVIVIRMKVTGSPKGSFFIRFNERGSKRQLFHFNPRFADKVVIVNCMNDLLQWLSEEYRHKTFPFELDKEFQLAIAMGSTCFRVAHEGKHLLTYDFKVTRANLPKAFTGHHHIFEKLTGFKMFGLQGMKLEVLFVDHIQTKEELTHYEIFSNQSYGK